MSWWILLFAGFLEMGWVIGLKQSEGLAKPLPAAFAALCMIASLALLALSLREIPVGTAYAVWTGIGAAGTAILGVMMFGEPATLARYFCIALILAGVLGLKLLTPAG